MIQNYQSKPPFSGFLPGIAGPLGVPVWCYYNNRGQGVCSFGGRDKDHAIMEFSPARQAYRDVARTGFRTFCKADGRYREVFTGHCDMHIGMGELEITCEQDGLRASAVYFGVPGERTAALARRVRESALYDRELGMYKVNESLAGVSLEAGRAVAFSPGWLENESIWLHMEYKYFLELLKSGLYEEFAQAFRAAVPFLDPERYGRSPLENVSFWPPRPTPTRPGGGRALWRGCPGPRRSFCRCGSSCSLGPPPSAGRMESCGWSWSPFSPTISCRTTAWCAPPFSEMFRSPTAPPAVRRWSRAGRSRCAGRSPGAAAHGQ